MINGFVVEEQIVSNYKHSLSATDCCITGRTDRKCSQGEEPCDESAAYLESWWVSRLVPYPYPVCGLL